MSARKTAASSLTSSGRTWSVRPAFGTRTSSAWPPSRRGYTPEDPPVLEARGEPVERKEVGSADRGRGDLDDRVRRRLELRIRRGRAGDVADSAQDDRSHAGCSSSTR